MDYSKTLVVIPTYNEAQNIRALLVRLLEDAASIHVLVVDDDSPDGTGDIVKRFADGKSNVFLLSRPKKEGLAAAYIAGFQWALGRHYQNIIEMDADFSHDPSYVPVIVKALAEHDVVMGCRYIPQGGVSGWSFLRKWISRGGNIYAQTMLGLSYRDLTGGFNGWRRKVLETIKIAELRSKGYAFQVELKFRAHRAGFRLKEIPIHFENRRFGKSKMSGRIVFEAAFRVCELRWMLR